MSAQAELIPTSREYGTVLLYSMREHEPLHERFVHADIGKRIARMLGIDYGGMHEPGAAYSGPLYFIPSDTIIGLHTAENAGIHGEDDLFGGVVPYAFVPTKSITHGLLHQNAFAPQGWSHDFADSVRESVLGGLTVFTLEDARLAADRMLRDGPIRLKPVHATAGRGQIVIHHADELGAALEELDTRKLGESGLVLEENLDDVETFSVGQVRVRGRIASYVGTQSLTADNHGEMVYGGSSLVVVRGGFDALKRLDLSDVYRDAIDKARIYDAAATANFPGFFASRRNYDIAKGIDAKGHIRCGVLEQSWRTGGASAAEIAALEAFDADPTLTTIRASTIERFGEHAPPPGARTLFTGDDPDIGRISKYVITEPYGNG